MKIVALLSLTAILAYACFEHAGVEPATWNPCMLAMGTVAALYFPMPRRRVQGLNRPLAFCLFAAVGVAALQVAPLPLSVVRILSPARMELLRATAPVAGRLPHFVTLSVAPYATAQAALSLAAYAVVFLTIRDLTLRLRRTPWAVVGPLIAVAGLEALLGFVQAYGVGGDQATGTYNSRDHYAGLLEMVLPFAVMYAVAILQRNRGPQGVRGRAAIAACAMMSAGALMLISTVFSLSRMGFFCALAALLLSGLLALAIRGWRLGYKAPSPLWRRALPFAIVVVAILTGVAVLPTEPLIGRFSDLASTDDINPDTRVQLWRDTVPMIKDYPWFGCGFGAYESGFLRYKTVAPLNTADYAHNDYVQALAELGIFGFAAGMFIVFRILVGAGRRILYAQSVDERYCSIACVAAMSAMLLHSIVDFNMYVPTNAMVFAWIAGIASCSLVPGAKLPDEEAVDHAYV